MGRRNPRCKTCGDVVPEVDEYGECEACRSEHQDHDPD